MLDEEVEAALGGFQVHRVVGQLPQAVAQDRIDLPFDVLECRKSGGDISAGQSSALDGRAQDRVRVVELSREGKGLLEMGRFGIDPAQSDQRRGDPGLVGELPAEGERLPVVLSCPLQVPDLLVA